MHWYILWRFQTREQSSFFYFLFILFLNVLYYSALETKVIVRFQIQGYVCSINFGLIDANMVSKSTSLNSAPSSVLGFMIGHTIWKLEIGIVAIPPCQEGQSERTFFCIFFPIFPLFPSFRFFPSLAIFPLSRVLAIFFTVRGHSAPPAATGYVTVGSLCLHG